MIDFKDLKENIEEVKKFLQGEFAGIRTGAASVAILDPIKVEAYGSMTPISQLANISVQDATSILIAPYDVSISGAIEKAINDSGTGLSVSNGGSSIRISFPSLTADRRVMLLKLAKEKLEEGRVRLRRERDGKKSEIEKATKDGEISEDDKFALMEEMEKMIKDTNKIFDEIFSNKEGEINE
jgi:ribosome recycling factor